MHIIDKDIDRLTRNPHTAKAFDSLATIQLTFKAMLAVVECAEEVLKSYELDEDGDPDKTATDHHRQQTWGYLKDALADMENVND